MDHLVPAPLSLPVFTVLAVLFAVAVGAGMVAAGLHLYNRAAEARREEGTDSMATYHILVVEDDPDINRLLCRILTDGGYDGRPAFSGSEAGLWAEQYEYDLVLLDLMLPGLTGEEFIAQMRRKKTMPILVLSAKAGLEDRVNVLRLGADDFISKPFDNAEVLARVEAQLRRYRQFSAPAEAGRCSGWGTWFWTGRPSG
jgi:CheY-like chemotaxis protein